MPPGAFSSGKRPRSTGVSLTNPGAGRQELLLNKIGKPPADSTRFENEGGNLLQAVHVKIGWVRAPVVLPKAVINADRHRPGIARGLYVHIRIADKGSFLRTRVQDVQRNLRPGGIWLFRDETVASVNHSEEFQQSQPLKDFHAHLERLVG